jgi:hypothetical protein
MWRNLLLRSLARALSLVLVVRGAMILRRRRRQHRPLIDLCSPKLPAPTLYVRLTVDDAGQPRQFLCRPWRIVRDGVYPLRADQAMIGDVILVPEHGSTDPDTPRRPVVVVRTEFVDVADPETFLSPTHALVPSQSLS